MKKGWKIALISLGSLIGTIAIVVAVACWLLFTPARLTSIVNKLSDKYLLCENHFGKVSLSLFKTWPDAGLEVEDVVFSMEGKTFSYSCLVDTEDGSAEIDYSF